MKRNFVMILITICSMLLTSCFFNAKPVMYDFEGDLASLHGNQIINALKTRDKEALKSMFSKEAIESSETFDEDLDTLFEYFEGEVVSVRKCGGVGSSSIRNGIEVNEETLCYEVGTEERIYRIYILDVVTDTENSDRVGVWSMYIIKYEEDTKRNTYHGDGKDTPGINIAVPRANDETGTEKNSL